MSDKAAGQKAPSPEGCDENGPAAALLLGHLSIQICSLLPPVRLGPPCRRPILIATPLPQSLTWCTSDQCSLRAMNARVEVSFRDHRTRGQTDGRPKSEPLLPASDYEFRGWKPSGSHLIAD